MKRITLLCALLLPVSFGVVGCDRATDVAAAGSKSGQGSSGDGAELEPIALTLFTPKVELFMEYVPPVRGEPVKFVSHFTILQTGEPVRVGRLTFEGVAGDGRTVTFQAEQPARDGLFTPVHVFDAPGTYQARFVLETPSLTEVVDLGEIVVYADATEAAASPAGNAEPEPADAVTFLMEQQWKIAMLLHEVTPRTLVERIRVTGEVTPMQGASAFVSAPVSGRLLPPESGGLPTLGTPVTRGEVLGFIEPALLATEAAALSANRAQVRSVHAELVMRGLELDLRGLEVEQAEKAARVRLDFAGRAARRTAELQSSGAGSIKQYEDAQRELELARAESEAAAAMRRRFEEALKKYAELRTSAGGTGDLEEAGLSMKLPLRSPIDGRIERCEHVEGEVIDALRPAFHVVNLDRVWITASVSEFDLVRLPGTPGALVRIPASSEEGFDVGEAGGRLLHIGAIVDPRTRTVPILYEVPNPARRLRSGMAVDVLLETRRAVECLALPEEAVVMDGGRWVVYVLLEGEAFQKREVGLGIRDAGLVEIMGELAAGERVVTRGAYAVHLASQAPASFGHGHVH